MPVITGPPRTCTPSTSSIHAVHMDTPHQPHQLPPHTTPPITNIPNYHYHFQSQHNPSPTKPTSCPLWPAVCGPPCSQREPDPSCSSGAQLLLLFIKAKFLSHQLHQLTTSTHNHKPSPFPNPHPIVLPLCAFNGPSVQHSAR